jgi:hypothetical protein
VEYLALCVSILSLTVSSVAYFRSGGARDIRALEQRLNEKVERLNAIAHRVSDSVAGRLRAGYMQSIRMISDLQSQVVALKEKAAEEIHEDLGKLAQTLDGLAGRAVREAKELKGDVSLMMVEAEISLRLAVDEAKARLRVIEAKQDLSFARKAINENDLKAAEACVETALGHLKEARSLTADHIDSLAALQKQAQEMLVAIRAKADTMKEDLDALIARSDRLIREMTPSSADLSKKVA